MGTDDETGASTPETPDYAGKSGGRAGGPGGHARDRLEELIAQRVPSDEEPPADDDDADVPDDEPAGTGTGQRPDEDPGPSGAEEAREEGHDDEGRTG